MHQPSTLTSRKEPRKRGLCLPPSEQAPLPVGLRVSVFAAVFASRPVGLSLFSCLRGKPFQDSSHLRRERLPFLPTFVRYRTPRFVMNLYYHDVLSSVNPATVVSACVCPDIETTYWGALKTSWPALPVSTGAEGTTGNSGALKRLVSVLWNHNVDEILSHRLQLDGVGTVECTCCVVGERRQNGDESESHKGCIHDTHRP